MQLDFSQSTNFAIVRCLSLHIHERFQKRRLAHFYHMITTFMVFEDISYGGTNTTDAEITHNKNNLCILNYKVLCKYIITKL